MWMHLSANSYHFLSPTISSHKFRIIAILNIPIRQIRLANDKMIDTRQYIIWWASGIISRYNISDILIQWSPSPSDRRWSVFELVSKVWPIISCDCNRLYVCVRVSPAIVAITGITAITSKRAISTAIRANKKCVIRRTVLLVLVVLMALLATFCK